MEVKGYKQAIHQVWVGIRQYGTTLLLQLCVCFTLVNCLDFNKTSEMKSYHPLLRLYPTSFEDCMNGCHKNGDCNTVLFARLANLCDLHSKSDLTNEQTGSGSQVVYRNQIKKSYSSHQNTNSSLQNQTKACSLRDFAKFKLLGNMNRPGDSVVVENDHNASVCVFTCDEQGDWVALECKNQSTFTSNGTGTPRDCGDLVTTGVLWSGVYTIFPYNQNGVEVFCDFEDPDGPWTVIQRRVDGTVNFHRTYKSYQDGFGDLTGNFWLGLEAVSAITKLGNYALKIVMFDTLKGERFAKYSRFRVMNASTNYMLQVDGYSGNAGDSFSDHSGIAFSTYDRDNDERAGHCAELFSGGWWFWDCFYSNLNGEYGDIRYEHGIQWIDITTYERSLKFATMKMKQIL